MIKRNYIYCVFVSCFILISCHIIREKSSEKIELDDNNTSSKSIQNTYFGWWIYGEGQHIFKDEKTLKEWGLKFANEKMDELIDLYLEIT